MAVSADRGALGRAAAWAAIMALAFYYLYLAWLYRYGPAGDLGPSFWNRKIWFWSHLAFALPVLLGGPLQFWRGLRDGRPRLHRAIGKAYVIGATGAALTALYLGATFDYEGGRLPLVMLSAIWLFFTLAAWRRAVARDFAGHRLFMIRSYNLALVFIWLRLAQEIPRDMLFFYISDEGVRDTTAEWLTWVVALIAMEFYLAWWPQARGRRSA